MPIFEKENKGILSVIKHISVHTILQRYEEQLKENILYHDFVHLVSDGKRPSPVYLPISFFKTHEVVCGDFMPEVIFSSSGTTGQNTSRHFVKEARVYEQSFTEGFRYFYGDPGQYCILALLPSYMEREGSSLVYMAEKLIALSGHERSGFFLNNTDKLAATLENLEREKQKTLLLGVSFALLAFAEKYKMTLASTIVMESGGMKGRREELTREELHAFLKERLGIDQVHSEYGMTELLSQAYSKGEGRFYCPPWMKVVIRDINDPFTLIGNGKTGGINIIDMANRYSCSFIETMDLGKTYDDGSFEILGRFDNSDVRGCNLLVG